MGKLVVMILLSGLLSACSSGPVRVHSADVSVDDTRIRVSDGDRGVTVPSVRRDKLRKGAASALLQSYIFWSACCSSCSSAGGERPS